MLMDIIMDVEVTPTGILNSARLVEIQQCHKGQ